MDNNEWLDTPNALGWWFYYGVDVSDPHADLTTPQVTLMYLYISDDLYGAMVVRATSLAFAGRFKGKWKKVVMPDILPELSEIAAE